VFLPPGGTILTEPGVMFYHDPGIKAAAKCTCDMGRSCTGESMVHVTYRNPESPPTTREGCVVNRELRPPSALHRPDPPQIAFAPRYIAKVIPLVLGPKVSFICKKTAYMCNIGDVSITMRCDCNPMRTCCLAGTVCRTSEPEHRSLVLASGDPSDWAQ